jgi:hypothetical protein
MAPPAAPTLDGIRERLRSARAELAHQRDVILPSNQRAAARMALRGKQADASTLVGRGRLTELEDLVAGLEQLEVVGECREISASIAREKATIADLDRRLPAMELAERNNTIPPPDAPQDDERYVLTRKISALRHEREQARSRVDALNARAGEIEQNHHDLLVDEGFLAEGEAA